jgi:hypothetical protein
MAALGSVLQVVTALLLIAATSALAAPPGSADPGGPPPEPSPGAATLMVWNRPIAEFRVPVRHVRPADRAANAARRIEALPDDVRPDEIAVERASFGDLHGVVVFARGQTLRRRARRWTRRARAPPRP